MSHDRDTELLETGLATSWSKGTSPQRIRCRVLDGVAEGSSCSLGPAAIVIGAGSECDLVVDDKAVSRTHMSAQNIGVGIRITDRGSTNGTF
ncbi:MAG: FHA domain-containing protein, partial [Deltaproteobacteria bacterium]|nr:FHA domain-containing protein [Deltaproteobacteria bacterium]